MSSALEKIQKLGYDAKELKSAADLKMAKFNTTVDNLCTGEVSSEFAAGLFATEGKSLYAFKLVKKGEAKTTVGVLMFVSPMRSYDAGDNVAKLFAKEKSTLGFDQAKQANDALELLVFCVDAKTRGQKLGSLMLQHAIEVSQKKFLVVGQELGPASDAATQFYTKMFDKMIEGEQEGKKFRYYVGLTKNVLAALDGETAVVAAVAATKKTVAAAKKTVAAAKKPAVSKKVVKRRRAGTVCHKVVARSNSFLNSVGKKFKTEKVDVVKVESTLSMNAACAVDAILRETLEKLGSNIASLLASSHSKTVNVRTVEMAIDMTFHETELAKFMKAHGATARVNYGKFVQTSTKKSSRAKRAGLQVSPARVVRLLRQARVAQRFGVDADIQLAGALDYLVEDLLHNSLQMIKDSKHGSGRLTPRVLMLTVQGDEELSKFFRGSIGGAGVPVTVQGPQKKAKTQK